MALSKTETFKEIQDAVISEARLDDSTKVRNEVKRKINDAYAELGFEEDFVWNGETKSFLLKGKYTTGTIALTKGSNVVTGTSTVWTDIDHRRWKMFISGQRTTYKVTRVASNTSLTLDQNYLGDTTTTNIEYTLFKDEYGLFPTAESLRWLYIPSFSATGRLLPVGPNEFESKRQQRPFSAGNPRLVTTQGKTLYTQDTWATFKWGISYWQDAVATEDFKLKDTNMLIWPAIFETDVIAHIRYTRRLAPLGGDSDIPLVPYSYRNILVYRALKRNYIRKRDTTMRREVEGELKMLNKVLKSDIESTTDNFSISVDRRTHGRQSDIYSNSFSRK